MNGEKFSLNKERALINGGKNSATDEITLTDLFEVEMLQKIQDAFSKVTGIAALITDANGKLLTSGSNNTRFCKYTRKSPIGGLRCEQCDKRGAELALKHGTSITYYCHAGLMDFAAPIMAGDKMIGCFIGGQVLTQPPDITKVMQVASELDIDLINYLQSMLEVPVIDRTVLENAAKFLYTLTDALSTLSYHKYIMVQANIEIEKVANLKSDFLANMSHEIRTPMNAVIGLAEMALREDLPPNARNYIDQIKSSGKTLLTIINDILDFSKVESGKMDIIVEEYAPISVINDVASIIGTRLDKENVELILSINPNIPRLLVGDSVRIKQIVINLANNAVKFTSKGQVKLIFDYNILDSENVELLFSVLDTGIGIREHDINKLFQSFQQLDSKRNRNIEGTGLGLVISKQLLNLMNGDIFVESTYGVGSTFSFRVPQKIANIEPSIQLAEQEIIHFYGYIENPYILNQLQEDMNRMNLSYTNISSIDELVEIQGDKNTYIFLEDKSFSEPIQYFLNKNPDITAVVLVNYNASLTYEQSNVIVAKKPLSALFLAAIFNEDIHLYENPDTSDAFYDFTAPEAKILIVDDNAINLTVCEGLLEPLSMQIDTAISGPDAVEKISSKMYDLILMDHMMPEVDGVETTHIIRRLHREYDHVPILALTANAVSGIKDMFIQEGMNDFIAKPIEVRILVSKLKHWLPKEKIKNINKKNINAGKANRIHSQEDTLPPKISDLDTSYALKLLGNAKLFWSILEDYYKAITKKHALIQQYTNEKNWHNYTIEVHALKSASRQIGALSLSEEAAALEEAGNAENESLILEKTPALLNHYFHYYEILKPLFPEKDKDADHNKEPITPEILLSILDNLQTALDDLDMDGMEEVKKSLSQYHYEPSSIELYQQLCDAIDEIDPDACEEIMTAWRELL